ncbi:MAG: GBS Bsp-like repeat-containing protein [Clostridia bacterium]|nr:GBS Bsp-like repeat-containing protein [Clostridia bacterium]
MKNTLKTIVSLLLCFVLVVCIAPVNANGYEEAYPLPNLTGNKAIDIVSVARSQVGYSEDANGGTIYGAWMTQQSLLIGAYYDFTNADWCSSFFCWCADMAGIPRGIVFSTLSASVNVLFGAMILAGAQVHYESDYTPQCGDFVFYSYNGYEMGHCAITDGNGNYIHANTANQVVQRSDNSVYHLSLGAYFYPVCYVTPNYGGTGNVSVLHDKDVPNIIDYGTTMLTAAAFTVYVTATDNMAISRASFEVWSKENGKDDVKTYPGVASGTNFSCTVNPADHGGAWGEYLINMTVYDPLGNNATLSEYTVFVPPSETEPPQISNVIVSDVTSESFTISCVVSDNTAVRKVLVPVWSQKNGTDDVMWHEAIISGNTACVTVPMSAYNGQSGVFLAQVYAYDGAENMAMYDNITINVPAAPGQGLQINNFLISPTVNGFSVSATVEAGCTGGVVDVLESIQGIERSYQFPVTVQGTAVYCTPSLIVTDMQAKYAVTLTVFDSYGRTGDYMTTYTPTAVQLLYGDLDGNGIVTDSDAFLAFLCAAGKMQLTPAQFSAADLDGSGYISPSDARGIYRMAAGLA